MPHSNQPSARARRIAKCLAMLDAEGQERDTALTQLFKFIKADNGKFSDYFFFNLHTGDVQKPPVADEQELGGLRQLVDNNRDRILEARKYLATKDAESSLLTMQIDALRRDKEKLEDQAYSAQCAYYDQLNKKRPSHPRDNNKTIESKSQNNSKVQRQTRDADDNPFPKFSLPNNGDIPNFGDKNPNWKNIIRTLDRGGETAKQQLAAWLLELKAHGYRITGVLITKESEDRNKKYLEMWRSIDILHNNMETILNEGLELDYKIRCMDERLINLIDDRDAITNDISSLHSQINYYNAKIKPANNNHSASKPSAAGAAGSQRPTASIPAPTNPSTTSSLIPPAAASQQAGSPQTHGPATPASSPVTGSRQTSSILHPGTFTGAWKAHAKQELGQINTPPASSSATSPPSVRPGINIAGAFRAGVEPAPSTTGSSSQTQGPSATSAPASSGAQKAASPATPSSATGKQSTSGAKVTTSTQQSPFVMPSNIVMPPNKKMFTQYKIAGAALLGIFTITGMSIINNIGNTPPQKQVDMYINSNNTFVWSSINGSNPSNLLWSFDRGDVVHVFITGEQKSKVRDDWTKLLLNDGQVGYVMTKYVTEKNQKNTGYEINLINYRTKNVW